MPLKTSSLDTAPSPDGIRVTNITLSVSPRHFLSLEIVKNLVLLKLKPPTNDF